MHRSGKKDDVKRKKELYEAKARLDECERAYSGSIVNANTCRKQHELFKGSIYCASRILATDSDTKLSQSLEHFYKCQLEYCQPLPEVPHLYGLTVLQLTLVEMFQALRELGVRIGC